MSDDQQMPDLSALLAQAQEMMAGASQAAEAVVTGQSGGGMVKVEVNGHFEFQSVSIDPKAVDPNDVEMLEDLVLAALRDASDQLSEGQSDAMGGLDLGGLDLGGLMGGAPE